MANKKLNQFQLTYIDKGDRETSIIIEAKDELHCRRKFRKLYGMYYIVKIVKK